jgi:tetratricopeptide (TPR) repeat protein
MPDAAPAGGQPPERGAASVREELDALRRRVDTSDEEIDLLQIDVARHEVVTSTPWYRDPRILVAYFALLFSLGTTVVSYIRLDQDKQHETRTELTGYIQRLEELPRVAAEDRLQYGDAGGSQLSGFVNAETQQIANQAQSLAALIPTEVSTLEYVTIGYGFQATGNFAQAAEMYQQALIATRTTQDKVVALRSLANIRFVLGDAPGGRGYFAQARAVYANDREAPALVAASENAATELQWASNELALGFCSEVVGHIDAAQALITNLPFNTQQALVDQARAQLAACHPAATPGAPQSSPSTSP